MKVNKTYYSGVDRFRGCRGLAHWAHFSAMAARDVVAARLKLESSRVRVRVSSSSSNFEFEFEFRVRVSSFVGGVVECCRVGEKLFQIS